MRYWMGLIILVYIRMVGFNGVLVNILVIVIIIIIKIKIKEIFKYV